VNEPQEAELKVRAVDRVHLASTHASKNGARRGAASVRRASSLSDFHVLGLFEEFWVKLDLSVALVPINHVLVSPL